MNSLDEAFLEVLKQLGFIFDSATENQLLKKNLKAFKRGIDFYSMTALVDVMANAMRLFKNAHGAYPNIHHPLGFNEKIFYRKFFEPLLVGKVGNKLETASLIPDSLRSVLSCSKVLWRSASNLLPANDDLPAGHYYLKSNHGSNFYQPIRYPLTIQGRLMLEAECKRWLSSSYGINTGEWWYNVFKKEIFIEEDVSSGQPSMSFNFFVTAGRVVYIGLHLKHTDEELYLDSELKPIHHNANEEKFIRLITSFKKETIENLKWYATQIGAHFSFVRVDFFVGANEKIYLAELTLSPADGLSKRPPGFDENLGALWNLE
jgi:hypothetical protein